MARSRSSGIFSPDPRTSPSSEIDANFTIQRRKVFAVDEASHFSSSHYQEEVLNFVKVRNGPIELNVALAGNGPLIVCVHGFPELWYSWRHQIEYFAARGYCVAALDVRGYGTSSRPH